ncbi:MAG: acetyl-CoA carboxylase biotin carboxylase subunit [Lachnospiraceae bacterium]|nr:acetyl-CoA carboxylase biotin carboxylase subunit [Lachnospiraceae bacterium]
MINKVLIANRGEIAVRIIRACREMGIETVAVYSEADASSLHVQLADEAVCIGPAPSKDSYLNMENILSATLISGADAIHPGFGFLSENAKFAEMCRQCNMTFIGPSPELIHRMGNKSEARKTMIKAKVPVIPGTKEPVYDVRTGRKMADEIGYPVMIKASSGGGGKGMRIAHNAIEFDESFRVAQMESINSFKDNTMYIEKYIEAPRHIEFQILGDRYGNVVHLGERDCSIQRRHQKVLEESPSPAMSGELRMKMGKMAIRAAKAVGYESAGTIEFLLDKSGQFYFMEMNTRIQVEHPVTETVTGIDLIKSQIRIAAGEPLEIKQKDILLKGHSIECRINAENPELNFRPSPGTIEHLHVPGGKGVRVDTAIYAGCTIPPHYDPMIAKIIVHAASRGEAIKKMKSALSEFIVTGIDTNVDYQMELMNDPVFQSGQFSTDFIEQREQKQSLKKER